ncbi:MAG TPA: dihydrodipicolinate synthase family protein [Frankiaceae bacterium]|nr:dihydrodipicolinate synthase family protein [Frankiaceae bacterium]
MPAEPLFRGVGVALVTLFDEGGGLLAEATAAHAAALVGRGVRAVLVAGTTGEAAALSAADRQELVRATRAALPAGVPLLVGTGHPDPAQAARLTAAVRDTGGADAVLALPPPGGSDLVGYYRTVAAAAGGLPVLAYHFPQICPPGVPLDVLPALPVRGVKDSSGDAERLVAELSAYRGEVYVGSSALLALAGAFGATGAILALANLEPQRCAEAFDGSLAAQRDLLAAHLRAHVDFPAGLKRELAARGGTPATVRVPAAVT